MEQDLAISNELRIIAESHGRRSSKSFFRIFAIVI